MHHTRGISRRNVLVALFALMAFQAIPAFGAPVSESEVEACLRSYVENHAKNVIRYELADTEGTFTKDVNGLRYPGYYRDCYIYEQGSYGQITRKTVSINFLANIIGTWDFDGHDLLPDSAVQVQGPTKPLPEPPAEPTDEQVKQAIIEGFKKSHQYTTYKMKKLELTEPTFAWYGEDYELAVYIYKGCTIAYKLIDETSYGSIIGLGTNHKDKGEILMQFDMEKKTWSAEIELE